jgi:hypothetical protein
MMNKETCIMFIEDLERLLSKMKEVASNAGCEVKPKEQHKEQHKEAA